MFAECMSWSLSVFDIFAQLSGGTELFSIMFVYLFIGYRINVNVKMKYN